MASDPKASSSASVPAKRESGVLIFTYPKIIFIFPTLVMSVICWIGMMSVGRNVQEYTYNTYKSKFVDEKPAKSATAKPVAKTADVKPATKPGTAEVDTFSVPKTPSAFKRPENVFGLLFLTVFFLNLLVLAIDFPRFTILAIILGGTTAIFLFLYIGVFFDILGPLIRLVENIYIVANYEFYLLFSLMLLAIYGVVWISRYLDYWEILPNEILHHHGPLSDLERYPTLNLKFDKEIPDVFEHLLLGAGRLVLHVSDERKSIVLDNVLFVSRIENKLKGLMSRLEVRVTTDQEVGSP